MKNQILVFLFVLLMSLSFVSALIDVKIDVNKVFRVGEKVKFDYTFISDEDEEIIYTPKIKCTGYEPMLEIINVDLKKGVPLTKTYEGFEVTEDIEQQQCLAVVQLETPFPKVKEEAFEIATKPGFLFNLKVCKESECKQQAKIFLKNENIYLDYASGIENPSIKATLTYPDGAKKQIELPASIKAEQAGTYEIEITASKEGYKSITKKEQFGVIEKAAVIRTLGIAEPEVKDDVAKEKKKRILTFLISVLLILIIIIFIVLISLIKKKESSKEKN